MFSAFVTKMGKTSYFLLCLMILVLECFWPLQYKLPKFTRIFVYFVIKHSKTESIFANFFSCFRLLVKNNLFSYISGTSTLRFFNQFWYQWFSHPVCLVMGRKITRKFQTEFWLGKVFTHFWLYLGRIFDINFVLDYFE